MTHQFTVKQAARHRWSEILFALGGMNESQLSNKLQPCHYCDGLFRFDDKAGLGTYFCSQCKSGDGFSLLCKANGWTLAQAVRAVAQYLGISIENSYHQLTQQKRAEATPLIMPGQLTPDFKLTEEAEKAAILARLIWMKAEPAKENHPYLITKKIQPHGIKNMSVELIRKLGECLPNDWQGRILIIPIIVLGRLTSLQFINSVGQKHLLNNSQSRGGYYLIQGNPSPEKFLCIAEGFAAAAAIAEATHHAVYTAFSCNNFLLVSKILRARFSQTKIILCANDDKHLQPKNPTYNPGKTAAIKAAQAVGGYVALPAFTLEETA